MMCLPNRHSKQDKLSSTIILEVISWRLKRIDNAVTISSPHLSEEADHCRRVKRLNQGTAPLESWCSCDNSCKAKDCLRWLTGHMAAASQRQLQYPAVTKLCKILDLFSKTSNNTPLSQSWFDPKAPPPDIHNNGHYQVDSILTTVGRLEWEIDFCCELWIKGC